MRLPSLAFALSLLFAVPACSSDAAGTAVAGEVSLEQASSKHATSVLRFTVTVKNGTGKAIKTLDSVELDAGDGPKKASQIQQCDGGAPWLLKAGANATTEFTLRSNGPDRMAVEAPCTAAGKTALWEFQTFTKVDTNGSAALKIAMNGT